LKVVKSKKWIIMRVDKLARLGLTHVKLDKDSEDYLKGVIANPQRC
jgi:hypothetical protein